MDHSKNVTSTKPLEALESPYQIFLICLYSFTACFAFVSNFVTIIVMVKGKRCSRDLKKFLINLSVTDLLMAVFTIPFTYTNYMLGRWIFFSLMCPLVNCAQLTTITVSIYTLVAIAIDRYMAIMHPLQKSISWFKQHRTSIVILIWCLGISLGISQLIVSETNSFIHNGNRYLSCGERWMPENLEGRLYTAFIFATTFAMPMGALCIIYTAMGWRLLRYRGPQQRMIDTNENNRTYSNHFETNNNVIKNHQDHNQHLQNHHTNLEQKRMVDKKSFSNDCDEERDFNSNTTEIDDVRCEKIVSNNDDSERIDCDCRRIIFDCLRFGAKNSEKNSTYVDSTKERKNRINQFFSAFCSQSNNSRTLEPDRTGLKNAASIEAKPNDCFTEKFNATTKSFSNNAIAAIISNDLIEAKFSIQSSTSTPSSSSILSRKSSSLNRSPAFSSMMLRDGSKRSRSMMNGPQQSSRLSGNSPKFSATNHRAILHQSFRKSNNGTTENCIDCETNSDGDGVAIQRRQSAQSQFDFDSQGSRIRSINQRSWKLIKIRRNKVLKMLITIIGVFTVCWSPIQIFNILIYFKPNFLHVDSELKYYTFVGSYFFCHWISMAHSFMNPIIYSFMSKNFRVSFIVNNFLLSIMTSITFN
ncbi:Extracellular sulfatase SULF-1-like protein [Sarcoptes scabiei]|nr:Extracellular sulfatase SULF-1-like protein [Sarcoptes scabiei]